jgi:hypothetical protein
VAWVFAIVLDVEIFQVHEIIEKCKNHDPPAGGGVPAKTSRKTIAYTNLLGCVIIYYRNDNDSHIF